jgi:FkbM family methyltransferase
MKLKTLSASQIKEIQLPVKTLIYMETFVDRRLAQLQGNSDVATTKLSGPSRSEQVEERGLVISKPGRSYDVESNKPSFIFVHPNVTSEHILKEGIFESSLINWAKQFVNSKMDFIDIGAHAGTYALSLAPLCRHVYAFEPQRMTYFQLCGGIALNQYHNVFPSHCALGDEDGKVELNIVSRDGGGSTVNPEIAKEQKQIILRTETTSIKSLDSFALCPQTAKIGLIKIDVEGHELAVLKGAKETIIKHDRPPILFETWPDGRFQAQKKALFDYIYEVLKYEIIKAAPLCANMYVALAK